MSPRLKTFGVFLLPCCLILGFLAPPTSARAPQDSESGPTSPLDKTLVFDGHVYHDVGLIWNNETNIGLIGSLPTLGTPISEAPSARWPGEIGLNHLWAAGPWIGGIVNGAKKVVTGGGFSEFKAWEAAEDTIYATFQGAEGGNRYPWPCPDDDGDGLEDEDPINGRDDDGDGRIDEDFAAIGNQHFRCRYREVVTSGIHPDSIPSIDVIQQSFQWSSGALGNFIGYDFTITNNSLQTWNDAYLGMFADFDVPATLSGSGDDLAGSWHGTAPGASGDLVPVTLAYMHDGSDLLNGTGFVGFVFCGHSTDATGATAPSEPGVSTVQIFSGNVAFANGGDPTNDDERYQLLSAGIEGWDNNTPVNKTSDYRVLISSGPFPSLAPGTTLTYQVAMVAGYNLEELIHNAALAVETYQGQTYDRDGDASNGAEFTVNWLSWEDAQSIPDDDKPWVRNQHQMVAKPNPFNPRVQIDFTMPMAAYARLAVFDLRGHRVRTLLDGPLAAGDQSVFWDGRTDTGQAAASGVYHLRLDSPATGQVFKRVTLVR